MRPTKSKVMDPQLLAMCKNMCEKLDIDPGLVEAIFMRPDWEFVILAGAFLEAVGKWRLIWLVEHGEPSVETKKCYTKIVNNKYTPAKDVLKRLLKHRHISEASANFLFAFYELRNCIAHDVRRMNFTFEGERGELSKLRRVMKIRLGRESEIGTDVRECVAQAAVEQVFLGRFEFLPLEMTGTMSAESLPCDGQASPR